MNTQEIITVLLQAKDEMSATFKKIKSQMGFLTKGLNQLKQGFKSLKPQMMQTKMMFKRVGNSLNKFFNRFDGWALSMMFFGMAISRVFNQIWKSSTKVFQDVAHSVEGAVTVFDMFKGVTDSVWLAVGEALNNVLMPFIPTIRGIADAMVFWIDNNQKLLTKTLLVIGAIGGILTMFGIVFLGLKPIFNFIYLLMFRGMLAPILAIVASIALVTATFQTEIPTWLKWLTLALMAIIGIGAAIGLIPVWALAAFAAVIASVIIFRKKIGYNMAITWNSIKYAIKSIEYAWATSIENTLNRIGKMFNKFVDYYNKFAASKVGSWFGFEQSTADFSTMGSQYVADVAAEMYAIKQTALELEKMRDNEPTLIDEIKKKLMGTKDDAKSLQETLKDIMPTGDETSILEGLNLPDNGMITNVNNYISNPSYEELQNLVEASQQGEE